MPYSSEEGKLELKDFLISTADIDSILDIGAGAGRYYDLLSDAFPDAEWTAVEVWAPYIDRFSLTEKYNSVINDNILLMDWDALGNYDLVIMGDVLEHMNKEDALSVIDKAIKHSKFVVISIPIIRLEQGAEEGNPYETHLAHYTPSTVLNELLAGRSSLIYSKQYDVVGVYVLTGDVE